MDTTRVSSTAFDGSPHAPAAARRFVRQVLGEWHLSHLAEDAVLLTSELVTNAVVHAGTEVELTCRLDVHATPARLEIEVDDHHPTRIVEPSESPPLRLDGHLRTRPRAGRPARRRVGRHVPARPSASGSAWTSPTATGDHEAAPGTPASAPSPARRSMDTLHVAVWWPTSTAAWPPGTRRPRLLLGWSARRPRHAAGELVAWRGHGPTPVAGRHARPGPLAGRVPDAPPDGRLIPVYISHLRTKAAPATAARSGWWWGGRPQVRPGSPRRRLRRKRAGASRTCSTRPARKLGELLDTIAQIVQCPARRRGVRAGARREGNQFGVAAATGATAGLVGWWAGTFSVGRTDPTVSRTCWPATSAGRAAAGQVAGVRADAGVGRGDRLPGGGGRRSRQVRPGAHGQPSAHRRPGRRDGAARADRRAGPRPPGPAVVPGRGGRAAGGRARRGADRGADGPARRAQDRHLGGGLPDRPDRHDQARARVAHRGAAQRRLRNVLPVSPRAPWAR